MSIRLLAPSESPSSGSFLASEFSSGNDVLSEASAGLIAQIGKMKRVGMGWEDKAAFLEFYRARKGERKLKDLFSLLHKIQDVAKKGTGNSDNHGIAISFLESWVGYAASLGRADTGEAELDQVNESSVGPSPTGSTRRRDA
ncbi:hypothetical protein PHLCEN_2v789 [Hermanssonia centrifuga]|uniref:Uncharacterized protein n=1 Tax=Hermanssonia centrifuga TaxID=98765 RepID=A0A2R6S4X5_9APHY|nr:hypothetical protein PHLCEN_2v789 [Hermanssonia centrifuga]